MGIVILNSLWQSRQRRAADLSAQSHQHRNLIPIIDDALRHTYLTLGGRVGIDLRTLQELAGHSNPNLIARYSHRRLHDLVGAVERLPSIVPADKRTSEAAALSATGTDGKAELATTEEDDSRKFVLQLVQTGRISPHSAALDSTSERGEGGKGDCRNPLTEVPLGTHQHQGAPLRITEPAGARTQDLRINLPHGDDAKMQADKDLQPGGLFACRPACWEEADPDLARVVAAWPELPEALRRAVLALVESAR